ncbi:MAG TPA: hypothetical protein VM450_00215 [Thermomicrobiales bacterium]|nr:hypothetical protein [Thermomicrobiales bacterium]
MPTCLTCRGTGTIHRYTAACVDDDVCGSCAGTGRVQPDALRLTPAQLRPARGWDCLYCGDEGHIADYKNGVPVAFRPCRHCQRGQLIAHVITHPEALIGADAP